LQRIYKDPNTKPQLEGQASVLQLVHKLSATVLLVVVLLTSSSKLALFFFITAIAIQQIVIIVMPFTALVNNIVVQGQAAGLQCKE
jgi:hypothetical protein